MTSISTHLNHFPCSHLPKDLLNSVLDWVAYNEKLLFPKVNKAFRQNFLNFGPFGRDVDHIEITTSTYDTMWGGWGKELDKNHEYFWLQIVVFSKDGALTDFCIDNDELELGRWSDICWGKLQNRNQVFINFFNNIRFCRTIGIENQSWFDFHPIIRKLWETGNFLPKIRSIVSFQIISIHAYPDMKVCLPNLKMEILDRFHAKDSNASFENENFPELFSDFITSSIMKNCRTVEFDCSGLNAFLKGLKKSNVELTFNSLFWRKDVEEILEKYIQSIPGKNPNRSAIVERRTTPRDDYNIEMLDEFLAKDSRFQKVTKHSNESQEILNFFKQKFEQYQSQNYVFPSRFIHTTKWMKPVIDEKTRQVFYKFPVDSRNFTIVWGIQFEADLKFQRDDFQSEMTTWLQIYLKNVQV